MITITDTAVFTIDFDDEGLWYVVPDHAADTRRLACGSRMGALFTIAAVREAADPAAEFAKRWQVSLADAISEHLARINRCLGPVNTFAASMDDQPAGVVRIWDDHADELCDAAKLATALAGIEQGDWDGAWEVILDHRVA